MAPDLRNIVQYMLELQKRIQLENDLYADAFHKSWDKIFDSRSLDV